jgi:PTS system nitrogen regulatory IIA component
MTAKELSRYLKLHEITICKYASEGKIPAIRIGSVWRLKKDLIDK